MAEWTAFSTVTELQVQGSLAQPDSPYTPPTATTLANNLPLGEPVPNYLWQSIAATILCCWPLGIVGIIFASKVNTLVAQGDINGAVEASKKAKLWTNLSAGLTLLLVVLYVIFFVVLGVAGEL